MSRQGRVALCRWRNVYVLDCAEMSFPPVPPSSPPRSLLVKYCKRSVGLPASCPALQQAGEWAARVCSPALQVCVSSLHSLPPSSAPEVLHSRTLALLSSSPPACRRTPLLRLPRVPAPNAPSLSCNLSASFPSLSSVPLLNVLFIFNF